MAKTFSRYPRITNPATVTVPFSASAMAVNIAIRCKYYVFWLLYLIVGIGQLVIPRTDLGQKKITANPNLYH